jgi:hypothetical protein
MMKTKLTFWKFTALLFAAVSICLVTLVSFKHINEKPVSMNLSPEIIPDRSTVRQLYLNFLKQYPASSFVERSGYISKSTLESLLAKMNDPSDKMVYYYFGRTSSNKNVIMLFNDPTYNNLDNSSKFVTVDPFCPPNCTNAAMNNYVTSDK